MRKYVIPVLGLVASVGLIPTVAIGSTEPEVYPVEPSPEGRILTEEESSAVLAEYLAEEYDLSDEAASGLAKWETGPEVAKAEGLQQYTDLVAYVEADPLARRLVLPRRSDARMVMLF